MEEDILFIKNNIKNLVEKYELKYINFKTTGTRYDGKGNLIAEDIETEILY